jgi:hypothetical protein
MFPPSLAEFIRTWSSLRFAITLRNCICHAITCERPYWTEAAGNKADTKRQILFAALPTRCQCQ